MVDTGTSPVVGQFGRGVMALEEDPKFLQSEMEFQMKFDPPRTQRHARLLPKDEEDKEREQKDKSPGTPQEVIYF